MADALTLEATVQWRPRSGAFPPPWSTRLSSLLLAVLYPHPPGRGRSLCSLEPLRRKVDGATMTTPGGARTPPRELSHLPSCSTHRLLSWGRSILPAWLRPFALPRAYGAAVFGLPFLTGEPVRGRR